MFTLFRKQHHRGMVFDCCKVSGVASDVANDIGIFFSSSAVAETFAWAGRWRIRAAKAIARLHSN